MVFNSYTCVLKNMHDGMINRATTITRETNKSIFLYAHIELWR